MAIDYSVVIPVAIFAIVAAVGYKLTRKKSKSKTATTILRSSTFPALMVDVKWAYDHIRKYEKYRKQMDEHISDIIFIYDYSEVTPTNLAYYSMGKIYFLIPSINYIDDYRGHKGLRMASMIVHEMGHPIVSFDHGPEFEAYVQQAMFDMALTQLT